MFRIVFWDILPCKMIVDRRFRGAYCLHHQGWVSLLLCSTDRDKPVLHIQTESVACTSLQSANDIFLVSVSRYSSVSFPWKMLKRFKRKGFEFQSNIIFHLYVTEARLIRNDHEYSSMHLAHERFSWCKGLNKNINMKCKIYVLHYHVNAKLHIFMGGTNFSSWQAVNQ
jgi:hypothetical protein